MIIRGLEGCICTHSYEKLIIHDLDCPNHSEGRSYAEEELAFRNLADFIDHIAFLSILSVCLFYVAFRLVAM